MIRLLKKLKALVSPGYYAELIGHKYGLWDWALNNRFRHYVLNLTGWKWWFYQIVVGGIFLILMELLLNLVNITLLPWR
jgi:hypothetical protein